jgi:hypothetical protein
MHVPLDIFEGRHMTATQALTDFSEAEFLFSEVNSRSCSLSNLQFAGGAKTGHGMEIIATRKL